MGACDLPETREPSTLLRGDLNISVGVAPQKRKTREPILLVNCLANARKLFRGQEADSSGEFQASDFSTDGAGRDRDSRIVANALALSSFAIRHEAEFAVVFRKPDWSVDGDAILAEGGKADIALALNFAGDWHAAIVRRCYRLLLD